MGDSEMNVLPTKILLATDASPDAALAARAALDIARGAGSELHVVHVWRTLRSSRFGAYIRRELSREAGRLLDEQVEKIEAAGAAVSGKHLREGPKADEILDLAGELGADLVVIGARGQGALGRLLLGSVAEGIVYHARCPVLVVRGGDPAWPPARVVVGDDGSEDARAAARLAFGIGKLFEAGVLLVRAYPKQPEMDDEAAALDAGGAAGETVAEEEQGRDERALEERVAGLEKDTGVRPEVSTSFGNPAEAVLAAADGGGDGGERSLVAVGHRGLGTLGRMRLGSISTKVLRAARGPVLVYPYVQGS
ncbi:MAG: universal stress protein [Actinomycetota bacterium]|nr:universal stress protein [Actinomycetota bacterium]